MIGAERRFFSLRSLLVLRWQAMGQISNVALKWVSVLQLNDLHGLRRAPALRFGHRARHRYGGEGQGDLPK